MTPTARPARLLPAALPLAALLLAGACSSSDDGTGVRTIEDGSGSASSSGSGSASGSASASGTDASASGTASEDVGGEAASEAEASEG